MATATARVGLSANTSMRRIVYGVLFITIGLLIWVGALVSVEPGAVTTFGLTPGGSDIELPDLVFVTQPLMLVLGAVCFFLGGLMIFRGVGGWTNRLLGVVAALGIFSFLAWAASGGSLNMAGLLNASLSFAVPLTLGAFSGLLCERAGVVNIAIEGMMLMGAMVGVIVGSVYGLWPGLIAAVLSGGLMGLIHAILSVTYRTDQIISGTVINIFSVGLTSFISAKFLTENLALNNAGTFSRIPIPILSQIPLAGPILFNKSIFVYAMFFFLFLLHMALFYTRWGLRLRSVGEHPRAADTLGINVFRTRYMAVILGGMMAGFAGGYFTLGSVGRFDEVMTAGRGFISLAVMIFGNWTPLGAFGAGLLFGFADSVAARLGILAVNIRPEILLMVPYIATMVVLAGVVGRGQMPAADGQPYEKE